MRQERTVECECPEMQYLSSQISNNGRHEHIYKCNECGWADKREDYRGTVIKRK